MQVFTTVAGLVVTLGAASAAVGLLAKSPFLGRPLRWLWRRNVSEPVGNWHHGITGGVVDERIEHLMTHRNGGSSLKDLADSLKVVQGSVERLLAHDAERDVAGARYGPAHGGGESGQRDY